MSERNDSLDYDVIIIGAGISGINFAYRLQESHPDLTYCILEERHEIGGTWSLFQYPGEICWADRLLSGLVAKTIECRDTVRLRFIHVWLCMASLDSEALDRARLVDP